MAVTQSTILQLQYGEFKISYHRFPKGSCITATRGDITAGTPLVRLHSSCLFGEVLKALDCECGEQLSNTLAMISKLDSGVVVYEYAEGRGIGLEKKIQALEIQRATGADTVEAFASLGLNPDLRSYDVSILALKDLSVSKTIKLATQNPNKIAAIKASGFEITETLAPKVTVTPNNKPELLTKKHKLGHSIDTV